MATIEHALTNPLETLVGYHLRRASAALMQELVRDLEALDLKATDASVLVLIDVNPRITQSEIGRILAIKSANMAPITAAFTKAGLIRRERVDGRSHGLATTPSGAVLAQRAKQVMEDHDARLLGAVPVELRQSFAEILSGFW